MKVLMVDDEVKILKELEGYVRNQIVDAEITTCTHAIKALELLAVQPFELVILDIQMPVMTGLELASHLINQNFTGDLIFITAYNHFATEAFEVNAIDYILKPIREERLQKTLAKIVQRRQSIPLTHVNPIQLEIQAFGKLTVKSNGEIINWKRQKALEVFAYLLLHNGKLIHKDRLCDVLWDKIDPQKALANLQTAIWQIKKSLDLQQTHTLSLSYKENCYCLTLGKSYYDVAEFEKYYEIARQNYDINILEQCYSLYKGNLLEQECWIWCMSEQEHLASKYRKVLEHLLDHSLANGSYDKALIYFKNLSEQLGEDHPIIQKYSCYYPKL